MKLPRNRSGVSRNPIAFTASAGIMPSWPAPATRDCDDACHTTVRYPCGVHGMPPRPRWCERRVVEPVCRLACIASNAVIEQGTDLARGAVVPAFNSYNAANGGSCKTGDISACTVVVVGAATAALYAAGAGSGGALAAWVAPAVPAVAAAGAWYCSANCNG